LNKSKKLMNCSKKVCFLFVCPDHVTEDTTVKNPTEATLDSTVLRNVSSISAQKARAMKLGSAAFDIDDFVSKLAIFMGGRHELADDASELDEIGDSVMDWEKVGRRALAKSRRVPVMGFMLVISQ
jgi:hypothetical protein